MLNAYRSVLLALALLPAWAQAADPIEDRQRALLAGRYTLEGAADAASELLLKPDGGFEWSLSYGSRGESASGRWNVGADSIVLTTQAPAAGKPLFSLDQVAAWNPDAQKRLEEFAAERRETLIEEACGFVKTYRLGLAEGELATIAAIAGPADPARRRGAEASLAPALAALERSRLALETAAAAAIKTGAGQAERSPPAMASAAEAAAASAIAAANEARALQRQPPDDSVSVDDMQAADQAAHIYLQRLQEVWRLHAIADRPMPELREAELHPEHCLPPAAAGKQSGYAVVVGDPQRGYRAQGIGVEFVHSDGHSERTETSPGGWALAVQRPGARLKHVILQPADRPTETLVLDETKGRIFAIRLDTAAAMPAQFEQIILTLDKGGLITPQVPGRYVRD
jgi:hypothetical protein